MRLDFSDLTGLSDTVREFASAVLAGKRVLLISDGERGPLFGDMGFEIARRAVGLLPEPTEDELGRINSLHEPIFGKGRTSRPLRAPHHTIGLIAMCGQVPATPTSGEMELATHGVLVMHDAPEFWGAVTTQVGFQLSEMPVTLVATARRCACGQSTRCVCNSEMRARWFSRLGKTVSRLGIDCVIEVPSVSERGLDQCPSTEQLREAA